jgi:hypothetical protein
LTGDAAATSVQPGYPSAELTFYGSPSIQSRLKSHFVGLGGLRKIFGSGKIFCSGHLESPSMANHITDC